MCSFRFVPYLSRRCKAMTLSQREQSSSALVVFLTFVYADSHSIICSVASLVATSWPGEIKSEEDVTAMLDTGSPSYHSYISYSLGDGLLTSLSKIVALGTTFLETPRWETGKSFRGLLCPKETVLPYSKQGGAQVRREDASWKQGTSR